MTRAALRKSLGPLEANAKRQQQLCTGCVLCIPGRVCDGPSRNVNYTKSHHLRLHTFPCFLITINHLIISFFFKLIKEIQRVTRLEWKWSSPSTAAASGKNAATATAIVRAAPTATSYGVPLAGEGGRNANVATAADGTRA